MTIPYSATLIGISEQISNKMVKKVNKNKSTVYETIDINNNVISLSRKDIYNMAKIIKEVIVKNCSNLNKLIEYYGNMTTLLITLGIPITWQPKPNGVKIYESYLKSEKTNYSFRKGFKSHTVVLKKVKLPKIVDKMKSRKAIVPNIIHSLDSHHKISIVSKFRERTIFTIHDCFVIHPNDHTKLKNEFVNTFVSLYFDHNFLDTYHEAVLNKIEENYNFQSIEGKLYVDYKGKLLPIPAKPD